MQSTLSGFKRLATLYDLDDLANYQEMPARLTDNIKALSTSLNELKKAIQNFHEAYRTKTNIVYLKDYCFGWAFHKFNCLINAVVTVFFPTDSPLKNEENLNKLIEMGLIPPAMGSNFLKLFQYEPYCDYYFARASEENSPEINSIAEYLYNDCIVELRALETSVFDYLYANMEELSSKFYKLVVSDFVSACKWTLPAILTLCVLHLSGASIEHFCFFSIVTLFIAGVFVQYLYPHMKRGGFLKALAWGYTPWFVIVAFVAPSGYLADDFLKVFGFISLCYLSLFAIGGGGYFLKCNYEVFVETAVRLARRYETFNNYFPLIAPMFVTVVCLLLSGVNFVSLPSAFMIMVGKLNLLGSLFSGLLFGFVGYQLLTSKDNYSSISPSRLHVIRSSCSIMKGFLIFLVFMVGYNQFGNNQGYTDEFGIEHDGFEREAFTTLISSYGVNYLLWVYSAYLVFLLQFYREKMKYSK